MDANFYLPVAKLGAGVRGLYLQTTRWKMALLLLLAIFPVSAAAKPKQAAAPVPMCSTGLQKDWKKAIWRAPLHIALSAPVAAASLVIPPLGKKYVQARIDAEQRDRARGTDTCMKATIDLYTQTALVRSVLRIYGIQLAVPQ